MFSQLRNISDWKDLIRNLVLRNLRIRYKGSTLGFFWTMISPLFMMVIYFVFITLLKIPIDLPQLLVGILVWQFFVMCLSDSVNAITGYPSLIKRTYSPKYVFPLSMVLANLVNFLLSLVVLVVFLFIYTIVTPSYHLVIGPGLLLLPLIVLLQTALILGLSNFFSCLNVYFKDIEHIMSIILLAWFFLSPIMYPLNLVREKTGAIGPWVFNLYIINPMASIVTCYRYAFLGIPVPFSPFFFLSLLLSPVILIAGTLIFLKKEPYFADEL
ncbi:MAG: ABC transporter permease [Candidatus Euphemobacter frigidus]|nr:ABC transporter permease [Candidatus Euphemobacter frigidus]MDP8275390.1 ABC transporter permease [Candidatus Euphemobacter frigidus]